MSNRELLVDSTTVDPDVIDDIIDIFQNIDVSDFMMAKETPGEFGTTIEIRNKMNKLYYVGLSEYGYVEIIRCGSRSGKIVYMPLDD